MNGDVLAALDDPSINPTVAGLAAHLVCSVSAVRRSLYTLTEQGLIAVQPLVNPTSRATTFALTAAGQAAVNYLDLKGRGSAAQDIR